MKYKTLVGRFEHPAGTVVYECRGYDYGCSTHDTNATGVQYISVTLDPTGDYPFFTIAQKDLEVVE